jgi:hypothetical protein
MKTIPNWQDKIIEVAHSKGGVLATVNPMDNLMRGQLSLWPPPEIVQKLYRSRQERAFEGADLAAVTSILGFYSDLQSLHSEDALTWSIFGTLAYASPRVRGDFTNSLLNFLNINVHPVSAVNVWLWRRLPHPDTLVSGGPEIDFGIQTEHVVILGEAKWLSSKEKNSNIAKRLWTEG